MGWIKKPTMATKDIFNEVVKEYGKVWNGRIGDSSCPYEYFADHLRDYYDLTLWQCDEVCRMIREYYGIKYFYYTEVQKHKESLRVKFF